MSRFMAFAAGLICGSLTGVTIGLLCAPKSGDELRKDLLEASDNIYRKAAFELEEMAEHIEEVKHKADVIQATDAINSTSAVSQALDAMNEASHVNSESQQVLRKTGTAL